MDNKSHFIIAVAILVAVIGGTFLYSTNNKSKEEKNSEKSVTEPKIAAPAENQIINNKKSMNTITIETSMGKIVFQTYNDDAPKTVENFITLANKGFYNGVIFHRVISGFMIQGGDPTGTGTGGPGYQFEDELNPNTPSYKAGYQKGVVAMANAGPNTNGSQFFIMLENNPLPNAYTIFGKVISGQDVVDSIGKVKTNSGDKPLSPVSIQKVIVE
jgi:peptidyl-prolyl cis-trans isomerase A (cyclophilin A)